MISSLCNLITYPLKQAELILDLAITVAIGYVLFSCMYVLDLQGGGHLVHAITLLLLASLLLDVPGWPRRRPVPGFADRRCSSWPQLWQLPHITPRIYGNVRYTLKTRWPLIQKICFKKSSKQSFKVKQTVLFQILMYFISAKKLDWCFSLLSVNCSEGFYYFTSMLQYKSKKLICYL